MTVWWGLEWILGTYMKWLSGIKKKSTLEFGPWEKGNKQGELCDDPSFTPAGIFQLIILGENPEHGTVVCWSVATVRNWGSWKLPGRVLRGGSYAEHDLWESASVSPWECAYSSGCLCEHSNSRARQGRAGELNMNCLRKLTQAVMCLRSEQPSQKVLSAHPGHCIDTPEGSHISNRPECL